jgi:hypothetical protein
MPRHRGVAFWLDALSLRLQTEGMNCAAASSKSAARARARIGAGGRALAVVEMTTMQDVVLPPRSPGPGRP